jgi:hypothetical protein
LVVGGIEMEMWWNRWVHLPNEIEEIIGSP